MTDKTEDEPREFNGESYCEGCPGPQPYLDCEGCDESEGAKEDRREAVRERGAQ